MAKLKNDLTATGYLLNRAKNKMLLLYHQKLQKWVPPGGHLEINELPHECVMREVKEETGIDCKLLPNDLIVKNLSKGEKQLPQPYCILHEFIPAFKTTEPHMHVDFIYLLIARNMKPKFKHEQTQMAWFSKTEIDKLDCFQAAKFVANNELK